jgi:hypothetical protein
MHDVLGHRLSLLSVHASALEFRPDAPAEEVTRAAKVIRESTHQALQDLREVIGVLRRRPDRGHSGRGRGRADRACPARVGDGPGRGAAPADPRRRPAARRRVGPGRDAGDPARQDQRPRPRPDRPHRLPGRPGSPDQCSQARPRHRGPRPPVRVTRHRPDRRGPQRRRRGHANSCRGSRARPRGRAGARRAGRAGRAGQWAARARAHRRRGLRALRAAAAGFVLKDTPPAEIVDAVRRVAQGLPSSPRR